MQTESATGSTSSNKVRTTLTINVEAVDFDTQACVLRVKGRNIQENQYVKVNNITFYSSCVFFFFWFDYSSPIIIDLNILNRIFHLR